MYGTCDPDEVTNMHRQCDSVDAVEEIQVQYL